MGRVEYVLQQYKNAFPVTTTFSPMANPLRQHAFPRTPRMVYAKIPWGLTQFAERDIIGYSGDYAQLLDTAHAGKLA